MAVGFVLVTSFGVRLQSLEEMQELCGRVGLAGGLQKERGDGVPSGLLPVVTLLVYFSPGGFLLSGGRQGA